MWHAPFLCLFLWAHSTIGQNLNDCTAFSTDGLAASRYQYYSFYDFRNQKASEDSSALTTGSRAKVVTGPSWKDDWYIRDFPRKSPGVSSIPVNFVPEKVYITNETNSKLNYRSYLSLSTVRVNDETQDSGEITFKEFNASYASVRVYGRVRGAAGAIAGIFTYLNDTQESDIEMLTRAPAQYIQYSNQPTTLGEPSWEAIPGATVNVSLPHAKLYTDWHVHRLDWTPGRSVFFLDGEQTNTTTLHVPIAHPPSGLYINIWSANSTWSGSMEVGKNATFDILWIELLFNTSQPVGDASPERICTIQDHNATVSGGSVIGKQAKGVDGQWLAWLLLSTVFVLACEFV